MIWRERYRGLPFTEGQVEEIGALLGLEQQEQAYEAAEAITRAVALYDISYSAKKRMGPIDKVSAKLAQIAAVAADLAELLEDDAICDQPLGGLWEILGSRPELKALERPPLWGDRATTLNEVRRIVGNVAVAAGKMANDDTRLRAYYFLPPRHAANNNLETFALWPTLFTIWEQHDRRVAGSAGGTNKLHRFVNLCHEGAGLGQPSLNTLNRAIQRWKEDPRRDRPQNKAWYFGNSPEDSGTIEEA